MDDVLYGVIGWIIIIAIIIRLIIKARKNR